MSNTNGVLSDLQIKSVMHRKVSYLQSDCQNIEPNCLSELIKQ